MKVDHVLAQAYQHSIPPAYPQVHLCDVFLSTSFFPRTVGDTGKAQSVSKVIGKAAMKKVEEQNGRCLPYSQSGLGRE